MKKNKKIKNSQKNRKAQVRDISIVLAGQAGQGIMTVEKIVTSVLKREGFYVFSTREYMSRVRGGINATQIRISDVPIAAPVNRIDFFVPFVPEAFEKYCDWITGDTQIMCGKSIIDFCKCAKACRNAIAIDFRGIANDVGHSLYVNTVAAGAIIALLDIPSTQARDILQSIFISKSERVIDDNVRAFDRGYKHGSHELFLADKELFPSITRAPEEIDDTVFLAGHEAVALGALAGGVDFCTSYPMSPSTGVLTYIAQHGKECGVAVEQATDEIGAVNMSVGASYAGARPIVTTSGGGFALMTETVSLAAMTETPLTIHVAQRPGPATGLPTHTAQEDLNLVLYAGHGEFVRAIYAPGSVGEAFNLTAHAVAQAHEYQIPTFILTDQYLMDSLAITPISEFIFDGDDKKNIVSSENDYERYEFTKNGISPRCVPGYGNGYICADSDEHDESGHITQDGDMRVRMMDKRLKKLESLKKTAFLPTRIGARGSKATKAFVVWGSNLSVAREALIVSGVDNVTVFHFSQVYPLNNRVFVSLQKFDSITVMENNQSGQFADLLEREAGVVIDNRINKYDGSPFCVEEVEKYIKSL